jgi:hypothetical protein
MTGFAPLPRRAGRIAYTHAATGELWGEEHFAIVRGAEGDRTLTAHCEMAFGDDQVVRETVLTVAADWRPRDAYVSIRNHGRVTGCGWFRFTESEAECESWTEAQGRISQRIKIDGPMRGFGLHALATDGWMASTFPFERGPGHVHHWPHNLIHSLHHFGATGPFIHTSATGFRYVGPERITVQAVEMDCRRIAFVGMTNAHPPYDMWVSADGDCLYVKGVVGGYMDSVFELTELEGECLA